MRKIVMALAVSLLPVLGMATSSPASASAPGNMTLLDRIAQPQSGVDLVRHRCYRTCHRECRKRILGKCVSHRQVCRTRCPRH